MNRSAFNASALGAGSPSNTRAGAVAALCTLVGSLSGSAVRFAQIAGTVTFAGALAGAQFFYRAITGVVALGGTAAGVVWRRNPGSATGIMRMRHGCRGNVHRRGGAASVVVLSGRVDATTWTRRFYTVAGVFRLEGALAGQDVTTSLAPVERTSAVAESGRVAFVASSQNTTGV